LRIPISAAATGPQAHRRGAPGAREPFLAIGCQKAEGGVPGRIPRHPGIADGLWTGTKITGPGALGMETCHRQAKNSSKTLDRFHKGKKPQNPSFVARISVKIV
jgi:hypothetical protein